MKKLKLLLAATAVTAGALVAPLTASPAHAASDYTLSWVGLCAYGGGATGCNIGNVSLNVTSTYSYNQIWINGHVYCTHGGGWVFTWCSNTNNGKSYLNVGVNWTGSTTSGFNKGETSWWRMNILANGAGCNEWDGYATPTFVNDFGCEEAYSGPAT